MAFSVWEEANVLAPSPLPLQTASIHCDGLVPSPGSAVLLQCFPLCLALGFSFLSPHKCSLADVVHAEFSGSPLAASGLVGSYKALSVSTWPFLFSSGGKAGWVSWLRAMPFGCTSCALLVEPMAFPQKSIHSAMETCKCLVKTSPYSPLAPVLQQLVLLSPSCALFWQFHLLQPSLPLRIWRPGCRVKGS